MKTPELKGEARNIFLKLLSIAEKDSKKAVKIDNSNGSFMPVHVEILSSINFSGYPSRIVSVSHYFEENGDLVPDPDMEFIIIDSKEPVIYPASFQNQLLYDRAIEQADGRWLYNRKTLAELTGFAEMWMKNIAFQQDL